MKEYTYDRNARYARTHEWVRLDGSEVVSGVSDVAQDLLSDVVFVDLPAVGATFKQGDVFGAVESVKAAEDVYMPLSGTIVAVNGELADNAEWVNQDPYGKAWFIRIKPANAAAEMATLMDAASYKKYAEEEAAQGH
ncbi:MAG: glycine cleavage system protein GcvH [Anaerolineae bacterium]|nr:glycine cleavage system protein GcvH [Anaerolineae bacterium]